MAFEYKKGPFRVVWRRKAASTAFTQNALCYENGTGEVIPADATSGDHVGVNIKTIASTDGDYASLTSIPLIKTTGDVEFKTDVGTGTPTEATEGTYFDLADSLTLDVSATAKNVVFCTRFVSATILWVVVSANAYERRIATT